MLQGIKLKASPNNHQRTILSQWMGCARYIWNAKVIEDKEQRVRLNSIESKQYPSINKTYSHFKIEQETPWLFQVPSVILRNAVSNWAETYRSFFKKLCGRPKLKKKDGRGSVYLTRELFKFQKCQDGVTRLFIGSKNNNIGYLSIKNHQKYKQPKSLYIKKIHNNYWVSFCYESENEPILTDKEHYKSLSKKGKAYLMQHTVGIDRGVARAVQTSLEKKDFFDLNSKEKIRKTYFEERTKYYQKKLSRQKKGSNRRHKTKIKLSAKHQDIANIRDNFCHQTSRKLVNRKNTQLIIFEDLGTKRMTRRPKPKKDNNGKFLPNKAKAKAGLNKNILDKNWYKLELYTKYKANNLGKAFFKIAPNHTSQECAYCHHIHPQNRKTQSQFQCVQCGHTDNADFNAAKVIKLRAIQYLLNSGTELSKRGVLSLKDIGRGAKVRHVDVASTSVCAGEEASKKKVALATGSAMALA